MIPDKRGFDSAAKSPIAKGPQEGAAGARQSGKNPDKHRQPPDEAAKGPFARGRQAGAAAARQDNTRLASNVAEPPRGAFERKKRLRDRIFFGKGFGDSIFSATFALAMGD